MEGFEYDVYEYFGELEYGSDSYWDARMKHLNSVGLGEKRKSAQEEDTEGRVVKKRRKDGGDVEEGVFMHEEAGIPSLIADVKDREGRSRPVINRTRKVVDLVVSGIRVMVERNPSWEELKA